ncbi:MAG: RNA polymerase factor sigma-54, partial [Deltaproteobacteria bacterium]|nr:RNA polymerase factor sigma-54 [Deltaproteobacteria bacterium]
VKTDGSSVGEIDWDTYLENYAAAPPLPSSRGGSEELPSLEATLSRGTSLFDHLVWQLKLSSFSEDDESLAMLIIGNLDPDGYLKEPPWDEIVQDSEVDPVHAEEVLRRIQEFDPVGVAARSLEECLLVQARLEGYGDEDGVETDEQRDLVVPIIEHHMANLEKRNFGAIAKELKRSVEDVIAAVKVIMTFDPKPGRLYTTDEPHYITPDVYVHKIGDKYFVVPNDDGLPKLKISSFYRSALAASPKAREYIQDKLRSAQWLIRSIQQRQRTIVRVTESIIKFQREFFDKGIAYLKPLILRDVAEDIGMHESTISRVTTHKYVQTPQGLFELKYFFNSGISRTDGDNIASESVKDKIKQLVSQEDARHPLSDQRLVELLREQSIDIARRTVAKYREQLGILSSSKRKQVF